MFEKIKRILFGTPIDDRDTDEQAGTPARVRRDPPGRGSSVAVAEPEDDREG